MDGWALATLGVLTNNGMEIANWGFSTRYKTHINDLVELICEFQTEINFTVKLYDATINIETGICTFKDIKTRITQEIDLESKIQLEQNIRTRLIQAFEEV